MSAHLISKLIRRIFAGSNSIALILFLLVCPSSRLPAQESPYIVTYNHSLEEPGNLFGTQRGGNDFHAFWAEFEYGATAWWTTALYVDGQTTFIDSTVFTGFRLENRFRLLRREHLVNPVLYVEYGQISGADKILKEVEGHDGESNFAASNAALRNPACSMLMNHCGVARKITGVLWRQQCG